MMRWWLLALTCLVSAALWLYVPVQAHQTLATDITGAYVCDGRNPDGSPYSGTVEIRAEGAVYQLAWTFNGGGSAIGVGLRADAVLSVIYQTSDGVIGLSSYRITKAGPTVRLVGTWTIPGGTPVVSTETMTKGKPQERRGA